MTPDDIRDARRILGVRWGLNGPLTTSQMARILRLRGRSADDSILDWEEGRREPSGPVTLAYELLLAGGAPSDLDSVLAAPAGINTGRHAGA